MVLNVALLVGDVASTTITDKLCVAPFTATGPTTWAFSACWNYACINPQLSGGPLVVTTTTPTSAAASAPSGGSTVLVTFMKPNCAEVTAAATDSQGNVIALDSNQVGYGCAHDWGFPGGRNQLELLLTRVPTITM